MSSTQAQKEYQFRHVHAVQQHLPPDSHVLLLVDDLYGCAVRSGLVGASVVSCSDQDLYTARLQVASPAFPELQEGDLIDFTLEQVLRAVRGSVLVC